MWQEVDVLPRDRRVDGDACDRRSERAVLDLDREDRPIIGGVPIDAAAPRERERRAQEHERDEGAKRVAEQATHRSTSLVSPPLQPAPRVGSPGGVAIGLGRCCPRTDYTSALR